MHSCIYPILVLVIYIMYDSNKIIFLSICIILSYTEFYRGLCLTLHAPYGLILSDV